MSMRALFRYPHRLVFAWQDRCGPCTEIWSGLTALVFALHVTTLAGELAVRPGYYLLAWLPNIAWVLLAGVGGVLQVIAARRQVWRARRVVAVAMAALYLLLADGLRSAVPESPSATFPAVLATANLLCALLLRRPR